MTDVVIRPITPDDDFDAQLDLGQRAFGSYTEQQKVSWLYVARLRAAQGLFLGVFVDGVPAGQWLGRPDLYSYLAGDDGFAAYRDRKSVV